MEFAGVPKQAYGPSELEASNVRQFLAWTRSASEEQRAEAAFTLAWAYRYVAAPEELHLDLELCIATSLDDPSPVVRLALAEGIAGAPDAPRHMVLALADDRPEIASIVVGQSRALTQTELLQYAMLGEPRIQAAIARRTDLPPSVADHLAKRGGTEVAEALAENSGVVLPAEILRRLYERFGDDPMIRRALFARTDLPAALRCDLIEAAAADSAARLAGSEISAARIERMTRAVMGRGVVRAASARPRAEIFQLVRHLRAKGVLTAALLLRALVSGERIFFEAAAAELSGFPMERVAALMNDPLASGFAAMIRRAGLPTRYATAFQAALLLLKHHKVASRGRVLRPLVRRLIDRCQLAPESEIGALVAFLRSLEKEAALEEARRFTQDMEPQLPEPRIEEFEPRRAGTLVERLNSLERLNSSIECEAAPVAVALAS